MLSDLEFATLLVYSPRGSSKNAILSKQICGAFKNGIIKPTNTSVRHINNNQQLSDFFGDNCVLVPVPRSSPISEETLWPTKVIAEGLVNNGIGNEVVTCLKRVTAVPKSSFQDGATTRPSVQQHYESLDVEAVMINSDQIILIDDVLTLGRTAMACASILKERFPNVEIKMFGMMRTRSFKDNNILIDPKVGTMRYNNYSGKVQMPD
ncbi:phosphoribosyltransferase [Aquimarina algiphila]|uniref:Phosphoribosyltransferase n=1 Tax=Aquimarina algiphila TaxID=2047982 RepID=A0A554VAH6_9FLAO|nr:phosphoribosyltransferase [Aquimarina algiphila]TSE03043.1 phosphoribosyltransferase [Aquimarina algiphila]